MIDTQRLRALYEADRDERPCPACGEEAFLSDCWQLEALAAVPDLLDEIDTLRTCVEQYAGAASPLGAAARQCLGALKASPTPERKTR